MFNLLKCEGKTYETEGTFKKRIFPDFYVGQLQVDTQTCKFIWNSKHILPIETILVMVIRSPGQTEGRGRGGDSIQATTSLSCRINSRSWRAAFWRDGTMIDGGRIN